MTWAPQGLYAILDVGVTGRALVRGVANALAEAGASVIQLRAKELDTRDLIDLATELQPICRQQGARFLINDRVDVCQIVGADGVHLGREDLPAEHARAQLGAEAIIGVSTHTPEESERVTGQGHCNYVGFGPVFATATRPDAEPVQGLSGLREATRRASRPVVAIGGIDLATCQQPLQHGAAAVALSSALLRGDVYQNTRTAIERLEIV